MRKNKEKKEKQKRRIRGAKMQIVGRILAAIIAMLMLLAACSTLIFYVAA